MAGHPRSSPRRRILLLVAASLTVIVAGVAAGCSADDSARATTTTTTTPPTPSSTVPGDDDPLPVAWVRQVGGPGDDVIAAAAGRDDMVLGVGTTTGLSPTTRPASGTTAAFVDAVSAEDGTPRATVQSPQADTATATGVSSASAASTTISCGTSTSASNPGGGTDAWCAPVGADATLGPAVRSGSDGDDAFAAVAVPADGREGYAVGRTAELFRGAKDPTGGELGSGDALVARITTTGSMQWVRQFGSAAADEATAATTSDDGDAVVAGWTDGRTRADAAGPIGGRDAWISRMDQGGSQRWMTQFGSTADDRALAVAAGGDPRQGTETFVAAGSTTGSLGTSTNLGAADAMVSAFDASGHMRWSTQFGSTAVDEATGVVVNGSTIYVSGTTAGTIVGAKRISLTPTATPDEGGSPSSSTTPPTTAAPTGGGLDGFLAAIDADTGQLRWVAQFGSTGDERVSGMTRTPSGLVVVTGSTTGQMGSTPPAGGTDGFMVAFVPPSGGGGAARIV